MSQKLSSAAVVTGPIRANTGAIFSNFCILGICYMYIGAHFDFCQVAYIANMDPDQGSS